MFLVDYKDDTLRVPPNWEKVVFLHLKVQLHVLLMKNVRMALGMSHIIAQVEIVLWFC